MPIQQYFATAALGLEPLLVTELENLGAVEVKQERAGVRFSGDLEMAYKACLWSRLASRILLPLARFEALDPDQLYNEVLKIDWSEHLSETNTLAVDCTLVSSKINHTRYGALRVKDAIVDQFRSRCGERPSVSVERPDVRLNLHVYKDQATLSLDLSGDSLHRRGYRIDGVHAPLKENLAAAILIRAGWPDICAAGGGLVDPLCGSGTLPLEAGLIATATAPGLLRTYFGFFGWKQHDVALWDTLVAAARQQQALGLEKRLAPIVGYDSDNRAIKAAWQHAQNAGLDKVIHFERRTLREFTAPTGISTGLLVANPPYGERLGVASELPEFYNLLGEKMAGQCPGWKAAVITSSPQLGRSIGLRAGKINVLYNGALKCQLLQFQLGDDNHWQSLEEGAGKAVKKTLSPGAEMFANRLRKNLKKLKKWANREGLDCYRLYDADLPEYAVAVDLYGDEVHLQEYRAPKDIDEAKTAERLRDVQDAVPLVLDLPPDKIHLKVRQQQKGNWQYEKQARRGVLKEVQEGNCTFLVNLTDYLDTGLFLDHRLTRQLIQKMAGGCRFLNLFAYTGAATVHALMGGAITTTTVDMSKTYLAWAEKNIALNHFDPADEEIIQADCLSWLETAKGPYDLIFLDPPTFSNSKGMDTTFDVQRDHPDMLQKTARLLAPDGAIIFSNNLRKFSMDRDALSGLDIEDISAKTIPADFERNPRIHNCWLIKRQ
ncbi:bifunctional 23S rRNA (guanine(2069)-N(7))-methyltransferase RlmK/23S rRNA (guanine(2445)-N(2))-methyltransferase RlmL [uncultured Desulfuromusa sp.]|uniref:bifunctional 23S rRNA (guanine(2069)-N(7))-methyltransferase RlmK/23S rRNA (guanine(2445)-N(2))-methyltransferase RlmL n=1 Tax=uncultured Desulfuromusa sp. TaxID=219183 RepID=UPI002AA628AD|nr:bifunctional 23S rRNA (guanine(2069)-N(7))-methyltransferase RlmK/23S rRNA (guanine(2445)-N(2))-methyltransferase RlmL [uncultured Desulfuromusa sp.]